MYHPQAYLKASIHDCESYSTSTESIDDSPSNKDLSVSIDVLTIETECILRGAGVMAVLIIEHK